MENKVQGPAFEVAHPVAHLLTEAEIVQVSGGTEVDPECEVGNGTGRG